MRVLWWRVCVVCGEAWHALSLSLVLSPFLFSLIFLFLSSFSFSIALAPSLAPASFLLPRSNAQKKREGTKVLLKVSSRRGLWLRR